ncbi:MAG: hypothetical protein LBB62_00470 [Proteiniphilum sp.]|nr:hypothetical protein [Proteiniphilum sp.]
MTYERNIDLMDESLFPMDSFYAQKKNPKESITTGVSRVEQTNDEIIEFVTKEMSGTLGNSHEPQAN